jgi:hypothetical protein
LIGDKAYDSNGLDARPSTPEPPVIRIRIHTPSGREPEPAYRPLMPFDTTARPVRRDQAARRELERLGQNGYRPPGQHRR